MSNRHIIEYYYRSHRADLLAFVSSRLGGIDEAQDIVQDVFMRLLLTPNPIMEQSLQALAYTIARNMISDYYRRRACRTAFRQMSENHIAGIAIATSTVAGTMAVASSPDEASSLLAVREVTEFLERGLSRIPRQCRHLYRMHVYGGMQVSDIARETGDDYKSVEYRLGIARREVRKYLKDIS